MPMTNVEIKKNPNENATNVLRRFTRKIQESGIIQKVKGKRYNERPLGELATKKMALKRLVRRAEVEKLKKLGKM